MAKKQAKKTYPTIGDVFCDLAEILRPPERLTVSQAAEKYRYVNQPGAYVGKWDNSTTPYMVEPMDTYAARTHKGMIFVGPAQSGKPLWIGTPVATPDGWKKLGDIEPGDRVFSEKGEPVEVAIVTPVYTDRDCYRITFDDGTHIISDAVHRWSVNDMWADDPYAPVVKTTGEMLSRFKVTTSRGTPRYRYSIPVAAPLQLPEVELPIHPYILGLWIGDGSRADGALALGNKDAEEIICHIESVGWDVSGVTSGNSTDTAKRVVLKPPCGKPMRVLLRENGLLGNKHIPPLYLRASEEQRRQLLRGLMDTDGTVAQNGRIQISQSDELLFHAIYELVVSLGYKPMVDTSVGTYVKNGVEHDCAQTFRLSFSTEDSTGCFSLLRQVNRHRAYVGSKKTRPTHSGRRFIRNIEPMESVPVRCIGVNSETHLFLVGEQMVPTHNTDALIINTAAYSIKVDPMDTMIVCPTMTAARDFSIRRIDRLHRHSEEIGAMLLPGADADNKFDKSYVTGMLLSLSWPTPTELAGKPIGRVVLTDRDRMPDDIDGDGEPYDLAAKRTTTFGSYAMTVAESSPSRPVLDLKWVAKTSHEAPPCGGILSLYNRGDRRRWYWPCPSCGTYFEGLFTHLQIDEDIEGTNLEKAETARMICPHCSYSIHPDERKQMNARGVWVKDGQGIDKDGNTFGPSPRTLIASFWLRGVAASFTNWKTLYAIYLDAMDDYERTGNEESLTKFYNNDLGEPYYPRSAMDGVRLPETLKARAEKIGERVVPDGVRFLVALIDVQKNMWVVSVFGIMPGKPFDIVVIDRFEIVKSHRLDDDGERLWVKPHVYLEDWDRITEEVLTKEYPLADGSGRKMAIKFTGCDSGGREGVTTMAYNYYRKLRQENMHRRFILTKGDHAPNMPRTVISYPDASRKDKMSGARGDVPVLRMNSNLLKDDLNGRLDCLIPGKGMYRFPDWLSDKFFSELCVEIRTDKGWENPSNDRNEQWDLSYACIGLCVSELIRVEVIDWDNPPGWAAEWDKNDLISQPEAPTRFANGLESAKYDFAQFGAALA